MLGFWTLLAIKEIVNLLLGSDVVRIRFSMDGAHSHAQMESVFAVPFVFYGVIDESYNACSNDDTGCC